jgi:hypothetical protein
MPGRYQSNKGEKNVYRNLIRLAALAFGVVSIVLMSTIAVSAHEERKVGSYQFAVGWRSEPTYTETRNAVHLFLSDAKGKPVTDLGDTLKVEIIFTSDNKKMPAVGLEPAFGEGFGTPGEYDAAVIPTRPGKYTFHFTGTIKGQAIDESFTSSATGFDEVKDASTIQWPADDPSRGQLAQRADRLDNRLISAQSDTKKAQDAADAARNLAIAGIGLGALGTIALVITLTRGRRPGAA